MVTEKGLAEPVWKFLHHGEKRFQSGEKNSSSEKKEKRRISGGGGAYIRHLEKSKNKGEERWGGVKKTIWIKKKWARPEKGL